MSSSDSLGDRMKRYENACKTSTLPRSYTIVRVDGRAFHTLLKGALRPYDPVVSLAMGYVAENLCREIQGARFAYSQSDEVSVLVTDFDSHETQPWFGGDVQKIVSISAAVATSTFGRYYPNALFDARVFNIPSAVEVANYFVWRQKDAYRNAVSSAARALFSHKELHKLNVKQMQEKMFTEKSINFNDYTDNFKRGVVCDKSEWEARPAPLFVAQPDTYLSEIIPELPAF